MPTDPQEFSKERGKSRRGSVFAALGVIAGGIVAFFCALYGMTGSASPTVFIASTAMLIGGIAALLFSIRGATLSPPHPAAAALLVLGVALHAYEQIAGTDSFAPAWLLWALVPYALCAVLALFRALRLAAIAGTGATLLFDLWIHYTVFVHPTSSTAALALIFAPLLTSLVIAPVVTLGAWLSMRR
jgi:hypothetical protein